MARRYLHFDVFTDTPLAGNQLAVFPDGLGLSPEVMQATAREMAFSETTFVLPREDDRTDIRLRIFTPDRELPMAGHPTIGSTFALAHLGIIKARRPRFVFGLGVGPTAVQLDWRGSSLKFVWMFQLRPTFGKPIRFRGEVARAMGLDTSDLVPKLPLQEVSSGLPYLMVPVRTRQRVDAVFPDRAALRALYTRFNVQELPVFVFSTEPGGDGATAYSRMFAPGLGVAEDPATGSAGGPLGAYMVRYGLVPRSKSDSIVNVQGVKMGRPSRIHIAIVSDSKGNIIEVRVGGESVLIGEGTLKI